MLESLYELEIESSNKSEIFAYIIQQGSLINEGSVVQRILHKLTRDEYQCDLIIFALE